MHILQIPSNYPNSYDTEKTIFFQDQAEAVARRGHRVGVLALVAISPRSVVRRRKIDLGLRRFRANGLETWRFQFPNVPKMEEATLALRKRLTVKLYRRYVEAHGTPDLIHAHGLPGGEAALELRRRFGLPYVVTEHSTELYGFKNRAELERARRVYAGASKRIAVSPGFKSYLEGLSGYPFAFVPNPVDTDFFSPEPTHSERPYTFASIGALMPRKNHALLVQAFAELFGGDAGYRLLIGGSGPEEASLRRMVAGEGLSSQIELRGQLSRERCRDLLREADCFVLPSLRETFGVVLVEAMACGLPVIATRCDGPLEIVQHDGLGRLVSHDLEGLKQALAEAPQVPFDPEPIRSYAVERYAFPEVGRQLEKLYRDVAG